MTRIFLALVSILISSAASSQVANTAELDRAISECDSLLFNLSFNKCDTDILRELISADFRFYHDQSGITESKAAFIESIENGLCKLPYKAIRVLNKETVVVYPLKNNGVLYGAIQHGEHEFYALEDGREKYLTSTAKFTHVWILEEDKWKLRSVLSYDHQDPPNGETGR